MSIHGRTGSDTFLSYNRKPEGARRSEAEARNELIVEGIANVADGFSWSDTPHQPKVTISTGRLGTNVQTFI